MAKTGLDLLSACESGDLSAIHEGTWADLNACHENDVTALQVASAKGHVSKLISTSSTMWPEVKKENMWNLYQEYGKEYKAA